MPRYAEDEGANGEVAGGFADSHTRHSRNIRYRIVGRVRPEFCVHMVTSAPLSTPVTLGRTKEVSVTADKWGERGDVVAAMFSGECHDGGLDYETIEALHRGEVDDWLRALRASGLVADDELREIAREWRMNLRTLLDILLTEADEMTRRRCHTSWAVLDRLAPLTQIG